MARLTDDRYLYLGLTVFLAASFFGIRRAISDLKSLTTIPPVPPAEKPTDAQEDSLAFETLKTLATHPNPNIAQIATRILIDRFAVLPNATEILYADKDSADPVVNRQSRTAIEWLGERAQEMASDRLDAVLDALLERIQAEKAPTASLGQTWRHINGQDTIQIAPPGRDLLYDVSTGESVAEFAGWSTVPRERADSDEGLARRMRREAMVVAASGETQEMMAEDGVWEPVVEHGTPLPAYLLDREQVGLRRT